MTIRNPLEEAEALRRRALRGDREALERLEESFRSCFHKEVWVAIEEERTSGRRDSTLRGWRVRGVFERQEDAWIVIIRELLNMARNDGVQRLLDSGYPQAAVDLWLNAYPRFSTRYHVIRQPVRERGDQ